MSTRGLKFAYIVGEFVLCFEPDPTKARVLYDAKILETEVSRDKNGARIPAYHIHFLGWNNSWDRIVPEGHILKNTDENRTLMKKLADTTKRYRINRARNRRIDKILRTAFKGKPPLADFDSDFSDDDYDDGDDDDAELDDMLEVEDDEVDVIIRNNHRAKENHSNGDLDVDSVDGSDASSKSGKSEDRKKKQTVELEIPESLKEVLEGDYIAVNKENLLVKLPADPNVINILEGFVKTFCVNLICGTPSRGQLHSEGSNIPFDRNIPLCKELVDGLRICFDYTLPLILLYNAEREQYKKLVSSYKYKPGTSSKHDILQSPLIKTPLSRLKQSQKSAPSTPATGDSSPKIPKLSPKIFKREKIEFDVSQKSEEIQVTPRRLTRQAAQDSARKSQDTPNTTEQEEETEKRLDNNVTPCKKRDMRRRKCSGSGGSGNTANVKSEAGEEQSSNGPSGVASRRADPPPPLLIPSVISSQLPTGPESVDSSADSVPPSGRENTVENLLAWQLLPPEEAQKSPAYPSLVYGAHHLIRLFVKLPELIINMKMDDHKLKALLSLLEHFLDYMTERKEELFPDGSHTVKD